MPRRDSSRERGRKVLQQMELIHTAAEFQGRITRSSVTPSQDFTQIAQTAALFQRIRLAAVADAPLETIAEISNQGLKLARNMAIDLDRRP